jgi:transposase InsO family protein
LKGLIHWKIVIHAFIDGKSRYVVGIRASDNNRSETVLQVFINSIEKHGAPIRVRGDHGTENVLVAEWMERQPLGRGSYIWGR